MSSNNDSPLPFRKVNVVTMGLLQEVLFLGFVRGAGDYDCQLVAILRPGDTAVSIIPYTSVDDADVKAQGNEYATAAFYNRVEEWPSPGWSALVERRTED